MTGMISLALTAAAVEAVLIALTLFMRKEPRVVCRTEERGDKTILIFRIESAKLPVRVRLSVTVENLYTAQRVCVTSKRFGFGREASYEFELSDVSCGVFSVTVSSAVFGAAGSVFLKKFEPHIDERFYKEPDSRAFGDPCGIGNVMRPQTDTPELFCGAREYVHGDHLSDIHMKLSAKCGKYMIKEKNVCERASVVFFYSRDPEIAVKNAEILLFALKYFVFIGSGAKVFFGGETAVADDDASLSSAMRSVLSKNDADADVSYAEGIAVKDGRLIE